MILGLPRGAIYYDYVSFIRAIFNGTDVTIYEGPENDEEILIEGTKKTVDEACLPIKLMAGQCEYLQRCCDKVLILNVLKDINGRWLCPKILGQTQLITIDIDKERLLLSDAIYFNNRKATLKAFKKIFNELNINKDFLKENFNRAYSGLENQSFGNINIHVETAWEFVPNLPKEGEIILPNTKRILLTGHFYNVYDKFSNKDIIEKLDELGIEALTEKAVKHKEQEAAIERIRLLKRPYWDAIVRTLGTAVHLKGQIDGIIYLSSFSCGPDSMIIELLKEHVSDVPIMVLKLDGHKGTAGYLTRIEAFADILEERSIS